MTATQKHIDQAHMEQEFLETVFSDIAKITDQTSQVVRMGQFRKHQFLATGSLSLPRENSYKIVWKWRQQEKKHRRFNIDGYLPE
ncbi:unnamed protein product [Caenorhabditis brenneri]